MTELNNKLPDVAGASSGRANRVRRWAVGLSLAAMAGAASLAVAAGGDHGRGGDRGGPGMMHEAPMAGRGLDRMLDAVKATDAQRTQIKKIMDAAHQDMRAQHEAGRANRDKMLSLFAAPTVDAAAVEALRQQTVAQHDQGSKRMTQALLEASKVLTPAQRAQAAEAMKQRAERRGGDHERGGRHGGPGDDRRPAPPAAGASRPQ
jgi:Spy/CpxP family protein refolding chaperone